MLYVGGIFVDMGNDPIKILFLGLDKKEIEKITGYLEKAALFSFEIETACSFEEVSSSLSRYNVFVIGSSSESLPIVEVINNIEEAAPGSPILMLVEKGHSELERCLSSGATFCLVKDEDEPFIPKVIFNVVLRNNGELSLLHYTEPMVVVDKDRVVKYANKKAIDLLGERVEEGETLSRFADEGYKRRGYCKEKWESCNCGS